MEIYEHESDLRSNEKISLVGSALHRCLRGHGPNPEQA